jgi:cyanophycin synthetase
MLLVDARRLTGPNLLSRSPLVIVELTLEASERLEDCVAAYRASLDRVRAALGLPATGDLIVHAHASGAVVGYQAPVDTMLAFAEMSEWAALAACEALGKRVEPPLEPKAAEIAAMLERLANPKLLALAEAARSHDVAFSWDDAEVSVGLGCRSVTFAVDAIPAPEAVGWAKLGRIPIAMVTGTNGKTTSSRLLARIGCDAGQLVGCTSSDGIWVGDVQVERGDWTGPSAARTVLRNPSVELAVLETARGGILRRGLGVDVCDVALITNISDDHLGLYGVDDLPAMTRVKGVVAQATRVDGTVVLNAHDANLVAFAATLDRTIVFFADLERGDAFAAETVARHLAHRGEAVVAYEGLIVCRSAANEEALLPIADLPITFAGQARYNVENALGVVAAARALGLERSAIERGLRSFTASDNPGRGQLVERSGVRVMLDFGHNPEGVRAVLRLVAALRRSSPGRLTVIAACAGDRSDREIEAVACAVLEALPDRIYVRELPDYLRGRAPGEVPAALRSVFQREGFPRAATRDAGSEVDALELAFEDARPGDFIVLLVHLDQAAVAAFLGVS